MFIERPAQQAEAPRGPTLARSALPAPAGESEQDWVHGFAWRTERCVAWQGLPPACEEFPAPDDDGVLDVVAYHLPVGFRVYDECTTLGGQLDVARVERKADAVLSHVAARELWTGVLSKAAPYDTPAGATGQANGYLASPDAVVIDGGAYPVDRAFALLEETARSAAGGQQVYLHAPIRALPPTGLRRFGETLLTQGDAVVVADSGYDGSGPGGEDPATATTAWLYATGPVTLRSAAVPFDNNPAWTVDRATNRRRVFAERVFAATFDPCVHFAIQVALPGPTTP